MANVTTTARLVSIRDKLLDVIDNLAQQGVTSYTLGDQTYTLADVDGLIKTVNNLDRQIAAKDRTLAGRGRNRMTFSQFNG